MSNKNESLEYRLLLFFVIHNYNIFLSVGCSVFAIFVLHKFKKFNAYTKNLFTDLFNGLFELCFDVFIMK